MSEPWTTASTDKEAIELVCAASKALSFGGLSDLVWGHVSIRDHADRGLWMKAAGWGFEEIEPDHVLLVSWEGEVLQGTGPRHIEYLIHSEIYRERPEIGSVVHAHSDTVNAFCSLKVPLRALSHAGILFCDPQLPQFTRTANLIRTTELGHDLAKTLGPAPAVLIPQHGFVTVGEDAPTSVMHAVLLERACRIQLLAMSAGEPKAWIDRDLPDMGWPPNQIQAGWGYLVRQSE